MDQRCLVAHQCSGTYIYSPGWREELRRKTVSYTTTKPNDTCQASVPGLLNVTDPVHYKPLGYCQPDLPGNKFKFIIIYY